MPHSSFNRGRVVYKPLAQRANKKQIERDAIDPASAPENLNDAGRETIAVAAKRIRRARAAGRPVMLSFGAHTIKNGLAPVLIQLIEHGWLTHLATNGAGIIHDWEFAFQGESSEDVAGGVARGEFGHWHETGYYINLALLVGSFFAHGYGESIGALIHDEGLNIPEQSLLEWEAREWLSVDGLRSARAADMLGMLRAHTIKSGWHGVPHPWKQYSVQAAAFRRGVAFTSHPMFGHDIIYNHPLNHGASLGRCAQCDWLSFAESVSRIEGGVYLSLGSAVMSPMIFEKAFSMAQNIALQSGAAIRDFLIVVADLAGGAWDWSKGEPPESDPAYYARFNKTFSRMGGELRTLQCDNRDFLLGLAQALGG